MQKKSMIFTRFWISLYVEWGVYILNFIALELSRRSMLGWLFPRGTPISFPLLFLLIECWNAIALCRRFFTLIQMKRSSTRTYSYDYSSRSKECEVQNAKWYFWTAILMGGVTMGTFIVFVRYNLIVCSEILYVS